MTRKNYRSDFDFILRLKDCRGEDIGWPSFDWEARLYTNSKANAYVVGCRGGVCTGCYDDGGRIHVVVDNHHMGMGTLKADIIALYPDGAYPDGSRLDSTPFPLGIELVAGCGDCVAEAEAELILPTLKGEAFTYEDFTPGQIADLRRPADEAAASVRVLADGVTAAETERVAAEKSRVAAEEERLQAEMLRQSAEEERRGAEAERDEAEAGRTTAEISRVAAETARAGEFSGWQAVIDSKQDSLTDTADVTVVDNNSLNVTDEAKMALLDEIWVSNGGEVITKGRIYSLNGIDDIQRDEAVRIVSLLGCQLKANGMANAGNVRTVFPLVGFLRGHNSDGLLSYLFLNCNKLEIINFNANIYASDTTVGMFMGCTNLREIRGMISMTAKNADAFKGCRSLVDVDIMLPYNADISFGDSPLLSFDSISKLVRQAKGSGVRTVSVHPDVYAKLTGDTTNAAAAALPAEEAAAWQRLVTEALTKNISFATA